MKAVHQRRIAFIGLGAIGQEVLYRLGPLADVSFTLIDGDRVERANIGRQCLCTEEHLDHFKVDVAKRFLRTKGIEVTCHPSFLDASNATRLLQGHALVVDSTDDLHARYLIDSTCADLRVPLLSGAVHQVEGQVILLHGDATLADMFPGNVTGEQDGCDMRQVPRTLIESVAKALVERIGDVLRGDLSHSGELHVLHVDGSNRHFKVGHS